MIKIYLFHINSFINLYIKFNIFSFSSATKTFPSSIINSGFSSPSRSVLCSPALAPRTQITTTRNFSKQNSFNINQTTRCNIAVSEKEEFLLSSQNGKYLEKSTKISGKNYRARIAKNSSDPSFHTLTLYSSLLFHLFTAILLSFIYSTARHIWPKLWSLKKSTEFAAKSVKYTTKFHRGFLYPVSPIFMITFMIFLMCIGTLATPSLSQSGSHSSLFVPQSSWGGSQTYWTGGSINHHHQWHPQQKSTREIMLSVVKNISEATPVGEILLNFRAEDKSSPTYNLT